MCVLIFVVTQNVLIRPLVRPPGVTFSKLYVAHSLAKSQSGTGCNNTLSDISHVMDEIQNSRETSLTKK